MADGTAQWVSPTRCSTSRSSTSTSGATSRCRTATSTAASTAPTVGSRCTSPRRRRYQGRFFHPVTPVPGSEHSATEGRSLGYIEFAVASGGYLVESNLGLFRRALRGEDSTVAGFRASAAVATYSRVLAAEMYGEHRPYGYVFGGSGGAYRTMACIENGHGVWDGAVPYIHGTPMSMPSMFSVQAHAFRVLARQASRRSSTRSSRAAAATCTPASPTRSATRSRRRPAWASRPARGSTPSASACSTRRSGRGSSTTSPTWDPAYFDDFWTVPATSARTRRLRCSHAKVAAQDQDRAS